jgi:hypothetical protein
MSLELVGRIHKELSISGSALYETVVSIAERVNRKAQIIRLHWQASALLERMERVAADLGMELVDRVSRRFLTQGALDPSLAELDQSLTRVMARMHQFKQSLLAIDTRIRDLKLEAIHEDLLRLQRDVILRNGAIERLVIPRQAPAVGLPVRACPHRPSVHIATILRGPFLLPPGEDLLLRPDDIVVLIGLQSELDPVREWLTGRHAGARPAPNSQ